MASKDPNYQKKYYRTYKKKLQRQHREYYEKNKERVKEWRKENKEYTKKYNARYYEKNKELLVIKYREYRKRYYQKNKERISKQHKESNKKYYKENKKKISERNENYRKTHKEQRRKYIKNYARKYYQENRERIGKYRKDRYRNEFKCRLSQCISTAIRKSLKNGKDGYHWESVVDFTREDLMTHIEKQFLVGMSWANYGEWHIDHEIPISVFNFDSYTDLDFRRCWALPNLKPMWAKENIRKHNKINKPFQPSLKI